MCIRDSLEVVTGDLTTQWHHVVATYDGTTARIYLDGALLGAETPSVAINVGSTANFEIGHVTPGSNRYFDGQISDVGVWNRALSQAEIEAALDSSLQYVTDGQVAFWELNEGSGSAVQSLGDILDIPLVGTNLTWATDTDTVSETLVDNGVTSVVVENVGVPVFGANVNPEATVPSVLSGITEGQAITIGPNLGTTDHSRRISIDGSSNGNLVVTDPGLADVPSLVVTAEITDPSGQTTSLIHHAAEFDNDVLELSNEVLDGATNLTTTFWLKKDSSDLQGVFSAASDQESHQFVVAVSGTFLRIHDGGDAQEYTSDWFGIPNLADGQYHHIAITRNLQAGTHELFIDGVSQGTRNINLDAQVPLEVAPGNLVVGQIVSAANGPFNSTQFLSGALDEFTIWNRSLSASDIGEIYAGNVDTSDSNLQLYLPFDEGAGEFAEDRSQYGRDAKAPTVSTYLFDGGTVADTSSSRNGTLRGDASISEGVLQLDGDGDYVSLPNTVLSPTGGSVSLRFSRDADHTGIGYLFSNAGVPGANRVYIQLDGDQLFGRLGSGTAFGHTTIEADRWYDVRLDYNADKSGELFVDGLSVGSIGGSGAFGSAIQTSAIIGSFNGTQQFFNGEIDQVELTGGRPIQWTDDTATAQQSVEFNNSQVELPHTVLDGAGDLTTAFWLQTEHAGGLQPIISGASGGGAASNEFSVWLINPTTVRVTRGAQEANWTLASPANDGVYRHFAVTRTLTGDSYELFVDGVSQGTNTLSSGVINVVPGGLFLGQDQDSVGGGFNSSQALYGSLDDFAIWDRVLTPAEILAARVGQIDADDTNLRVWLDFENDASELPQDRSINNHHAIESTVVITNDVPALLRSRYVFVDNGDYELTVTARDKDGGLDRSVTEFTVANVAPTLDDLNATSGSSSSDASSTLLASEEFSGSPTLEIGVPLSFDANAVEDAGVLDRRIYLWQVESNNGQPVLTGSDDEFTFTPQFAGQYKVSLTVTDEDGDSVTREETFDIDPLAAITVNPTEDGSAAAANTIEGSIVNLTSAPSVPVAPVGSLRGNLDSVQRTYVWDVQHNGQTAASGNEADLSFVPLAAGAYTATLTIEDIFQTNGVETMRLSETTVESFTIDAASVVTIVAPTEPAQEGDLLTFSLAGLGELDEQTTRTVEWTVTFGGNDTTFEGSTLQFAPTTDGSYTINAEVTDITLETSFVRDATPGVTIVINNAAPTVAANAIQGVEGSLASLLVDVFDADSTDINTHTFTIDWGDGSALASGTVSAGEIDVDHIYATSGSYVATITLVDPADPGKETVLNVDATIENAAPVAVADTAATNEDAVVTLVNLVGNDTDAGGDALFVSGVDAISENGAAVSLNADGSVTYDPTVSATLNGIAALATFDDSFGYVVSDGQGGVSTAIVTVTVSGLNDAPVAIHETPSVGEDVATITGDLLSNDTDVDGDNLTVAGTKLAADDEFVTSDAVDVVGTYGTLDWNSDGSYTFTLNAEAQTLTADQVVTEVFDYQVSDGDLTDTSALTITITGSNDAPVANADAAMTTEDDVLTVIFDTNNNSGLLANDSDLDGQFSVTAVNGEAADVGEQITLASGALLTVQADGEYEYNPNGAYDHLLLATDTATETFTYTITDEVGDSSTATVSVTITGQNDAPTSVTLSNLTVSVGATEDQVIADLTVLDPDVGDTVTVSINPVDPFKLSADGTRLLANRELTIADVGQHIITLTANDGDATLDQAFAITVEPLANTVDLAATSSTDVTIRRTDIGDDAFVQVIDNATSSVLFVGDLDRTTFLNIAGASGVSESVTVDFTLGGFFDLPSGIMVNGGDGTDDHLIFRGDSSLDATYISNNTSLGNATVAVSNGDVITQVHFAGVEPLDIVDFDRIDFSNTLKIDGETLTLRSDQPVDLPAVTEINGGSIVSSNLLSLGNAETLTGSGTIDARFAGETSSVITATGDLTIGDATSEAGFTTDGEIHVNAFNVTLLDSNQVVLGSLTNLGNATLAGTLLGANGFLVDFGNNVTGFGTLDSPDDIALLTLVNGNITGESLANPITLPGYYRGVGSLSNHNLTGTYSPGFSPATVINGSGVYGSTAQVIVELGGLTAGSNDNIIHTGSATLGGELRVELINGFVPQVGDSFVLLTANAGIDGTFDSQSLPLLPEDFSWKVTYEATEVIGTVIEAPQVQSVVINGGDVQRSFLDEVQITFTTVVDIDDAAGSVFEIINRATGASVSLIETVSNDSGRTVVTLQFSGDETTPRGSLSASLNDGNYELTIDALRVSFGRHQLDGNADGSGGDDFVCGDEAADGFFRLFGDKDADRDVDIQDLAGFGGTFRRTSADPAFNGADDFDGDGDVDIQDLAQFGQRFRTVLQF